MGSSGAGRVLGVQVGCERLSLEELWGVGRGRGGWLEVELADLRLENDLCLSRSLSRLSSRFIREISSSRESGSSLEANSSSNLSDNPLLKKLMSAGSFHSVLAAKTRKSME